MAEQTPVRFICAELRKIMEDPKTTTKEKLAAAALIAKVSKRRRKPKNKPKQNYAPAPENSLASIASKVV